MERSLHEKTICIILATVILFSSSVQVLVQNDEVSQNDSFSSDHLMRESYALEHGTIFLEETADYRIVFIKYDYKKKQTNNNRHC